MKKSLENQLTMCDMIQDDPSQSHPDQDVHRTCLTYNICDTPKKLDNDLYTFVQWQRHNEELLSRSIQGHHQSNV